MEDKKHDIDFFLKNEHFVKWVNHPTISGTVFWTKWIETYPSDKETISRARAIVERSTFNTAKLSSTKKDELLKNILKATKSDNYQEGDPKPSRNRFHKTIFWAASTAALFAIILITYPLLKSGNDSLVSIKENSLVSNIEVTTNRGEHKTVVLPDSTKVILNAASKLVYPSVFNSTSRNVILEGEAYFDVSHNPNKKFIVTTNKIKTVVYGTTFNVGFYPEMESLVVALESGSVAVETPVEINGRNDFLIHPEEKITINKDLDKAVISGYDKIDYFGWKDGVLVFRDSGLMEFITKIERWYNVDVSVVGDTKEDWKINGMFKKQNIKNVMESLEFARKVKYTMNNNQITIYINN
ncbi:FecR family protein [Galbibacter sp.]|uniref:FecR family protein n=1 Tax=Galbibacter sp. TaxID=2918471 RepID=UPI003A93EC95